MNSVAAQLASVLTVLVVTPSLQWAEDKAPAANHDETFDNRIVYASRVSGGIEIRTVGIDDADSRLVKRIDNVEWLSSLESSPDGTKCAFELLRWGKDEGV